MLAVSQNNSIKELIAPAVYAADSTPVAIDRGNFDSVQIAIHFGAGGITFTGTNKVEFVLTHSDDNSTFTNVTAADLVGIASVTNGIVLAYTAAQAASQITDFDYVGNKRYLKLLADFSGTHATGTAIAATAICANGLKQPAA